MSRSYKKTPVSKMKVDAGQGFANRRVRKMNKVHHRYFDDLDSGECDTHETILNGNQYRKVYSSAQVSEFRSYYTKIGWAEKLAARRRLEEDGGQLRKWNLHLNETVWEQCYRRK